jgi:hypothetical protein
MISNLYQGVLLKTRVFSLLYEKKGFSEHNTSFQDVLLDLDMTKNVENSTVESLQIFLQLNRKFTVESQKDLLEETFVNLSIKDFNKEMVFLTETINKLEFKMLDSLEIFSSEEVLYFANLKKSNFKTDEDLPLLSDRFLLDFLLETPENLSGIFNLLSMSQFAPVLVGFCFSHKICCCLGLGSGIRFAFNCFVFNSFKEFLYLNLEKIRFCTISPIFFDVRNNGWIPRLSPVFMGGILGISFSTSLLGLSYTLFIYSGVPLNQLYPNTALNIHTENIQHAVITNSYWFSSFISKTVRAIYDGGGSGLGGLPKKILNEFVIDIKEIFKK